MDYLQIGEILQLIINAIDNETLWKKHYENLREIEKDLPESVKQVKANENTEMPDSLDKLKISDFLKIEQKVYADEIIDLVNILINNIEQHIFIPDVFNFRERLKLTLCAACHITANVPFSSDTVSEEFSSEEFSYDKLVEKFKTLDNLEMKHNTEEDSVSDVNHDDKEKLEEQIDFLLEKDREFEEDYEEQKKIYNERKSNLKSKYPNTGTKTRSSVGGAVNVNEDSSPSYDKQFNEWLRDIVKSLDTSDLYEKDIFYKQGDKEHLIDIIKKDYNKFGNSNDKELREKMYRSFQRIGFSNLNKGQHSTVLLLLNNKLKEYIAKKYSYVLDYADINKLNESVEEKLNSKEWKFNNYSDYLKPLFY